MPPANLALTVDLMQFLWFLQSHLVLRVTNAKTYQYSLGLRTAYYQQSLERSILTERLDVWYP